MTPASTQSPARPIRLLFCCDPGYYQHLAVALVSLHESNRDNALEIHLITGERDAAAEARLRRSIAGYANSSLAFHAFTWPEKARWHTSAHITAETYTRIFAPRVLPAIDKILYLDADLVVVDDLRSLWETDLEGYALAAAVDPYGLFRREALGIPGDGAYVNAGVLLLNLAHWRSRDHAGRLAAYIERQGSRLTFHDQDAINAVLQGEIRLVDYRWNFQARSFGPTGYGGARKTTEMARAARAPAIIHYTSSRKPWMFVMALPRKQLYHRYRRLTDWRDAPAPDRNWRKVPERLVNYAFFYVGSTLTWDRMLRTTTVGRVLHHAGRLLAWAMRGARRGPASSA